MSYDHWKTTNPDNEWLGPEPDDDEIVISKRDVPEKATITRRELNLQYLARSIQHCETLVALCRKEGNVKAEASYEERLAQLNAELQEMEESE